MTAAASTRTPRRTMLRPLSLVRSRPWLFGCAALGVVAGLLMPSSWQWTTRAIAGWDLAILVYFGIVGRMMVNADGRTMREKAKQLDEGRFAILVAAISVTLASVGAIIAELGIGKELHGADKAGHVALAAATILISWLFIHFIFALHYANEFFFECDVDGDGTPDLRGGLHFPNTDEPRYIDFLYYSYTIGVAAQTADVETTSATMRQVTLVHAIVSFIFNTTILALTINIAAGLIG